MTRDDGMAKRFHRNLANLHDEIENLKRAFSAEGLQADGIGDPLHGKIEEVEEAFYLAIGPIGDRILDSAPASNAGPDMTVCPGSFVRLNGSGSIRSHLTDEPLSYQWSYVGATTEPPTTEEDPASRFSDSELKCANTAFPYFDAPELGGCNSIRLKFQLVVTDGQATDSSTVTVKVISG
ncbi:MAG: hypothetical protein OXN95_01715 [bacterium]|nr:hypothetical protein [bacterium]